MKPAFNVLMFHVYKIKLSLTPCIVPYLHYQVAISAQNANPALGEVSSAIAFSREGSKFVLSLVSQSQYSCINLSTPQ